MTVVAIIPARGGSQRVHKKNSKPCGGKPLIQWSIDAAYESGVIDKILVTSDDLDIVKLAHNLGVNFPHLRPAYLAQNDTEMLPVLLDAIEVLEQKIESVSLIVLLQPTSPLRLPEQIRDAIILFQSREVDSVVSVMQLPYRFSQSKWLDLDGEFVRPVSSGNFEQRGRLVRNGPAILITTPNSIKKGELYGTRSLPYLMDEESSIDIDNPIDFAIADMLLSARQNNRQRP